MSKVEKEIYETIFTNGKQMLSPGIDSVNFHNMTHEDAEILGMFCDFIAIHGEELKQLLIRGYLTNVPKAKIQGNWKRILIRNDMGGCIGARMICSVCNRDNGHDEYMKYCPNCGARLETHIMSEEGNSDNEKI